ncbi:hypothetical protein QE152_g26975 [Popillia japonica]|uniref:Uncharacterized protein n=1 Tax=Popillia japonica TaxID=7064 RepID=A0AAW1JWC6_POPJA
MMSHLDIMASKLRIELVIGVIFGNFYHALKETLLYFCNRFSNQDFQLKPNRLPETLFQNESPQGILSFRPGGPIEKPTPDAIPRRDASSTRLGIDPRESRKTRTNQPEQTKPSETPQSNVTNYSTVRKTPGFDIMAMMATIRNTPVQRYKLLDGT